MTAEMFDPRRYAGMTLPHDLTLREAKAFILNSDVLIELRDMSKKKRVRVQYLYENGKPMPDDATVGQFAALANKGLAMVVIDDGEGGWPAKIPEPQH